MRSEEDERREEAEADYYSLEAAVREHRQEQEEREAELAAARREGVIEGLELATRCLDDAAESESDLSGRDRIRAEIERLKGKR